jgi:hypothetical protein
VLKPSVACAAAGLALAGCGAPSTEEQVRETVVRFGAAVRAHDYGRICDKLLSRGLLAKLDQVGVPCRVALAQGLGSVHDPTLEILLVTVRTDDLALVRVRTGAANQRSSIDTLRVVRESGGWRIASLAGAGAPTRRPPPIGPGSRPPKRPPAKPGPRKRAPAKPKTSPKPPPNPPAGPPAPKKSYRQAEPVAAAPARNVASKSVPGIGPTQGEVAPASR